MNLKFVVITLLWSHEYPARWPSFFSDLLRVKNEKSALVFLMVLDEVNWSCAQFDHRTRIAEADLARIAAVWRTLLAMHAKSAPVAVATLQCMDKFIPWLDVGLLAADSRFVKLFYTFLAGAHAGLRLAAADCLYELAVKRMDGPAKLKMLQEMKILPVVAALKVGADHAFAEKVAAICEGVGTQLIGCLSLSASASASRRALRSSASSAGFESEPEQAEDDLDDQVVPLLFRAYELVLRYFRYDKTQFHVSETTVEFVVLFWNDLRKKQRQALHAQRGDTAQIQRYFQQTLEACAQNVCFPRSYNVENPGEIEAGFDEYRAAVDKVVLALTRVAPDDVLKLVNAHFGRICQSISAPSSGSSRTHTSFSGGAGGGGGEKTGSEENQANAAAAAPWFVVEGALHMMYKMVEAYDGGRNIDSLVRRNAAVSALFERAIGAEIGKGATRASTHPKVLVEYLHVCIRYWAFLTVKPQLIPRVLHAFTLPAVKRHPVVRSRSTYILNKLVRNLFNTSKGGLRQVSGDLLAHLKGLLKSFVQQAAGAAAIDVDEAQNTCETLAYLSLLTEKPGSPPLSLSAFHFSSLFLNSKTTL